MLLYRFRVIGLLALLLGLTFVLVGCTKDHSDDGKDELVQRQKSDIAALQRQVSDRDSQVQRLQEMVAEPMKEAAKWKYCFLGGIALCSLLGVLVGTAIGSKARRDSVSSQEETAGETTNEQ